jgi:hypothetical protein
MCALDHLSFSIRSHASCLPFHRKKRSLESIFSLVERAREKTQVEIWIQFITYAKTYGTIYSITVPTV